MIRRIATLAVIGCALAFAQQSQTAQTQEKEAGGWRQVAEPAPGEIVVPPGTRIPLSLINSISTKNSAEGDRVYLETVFPVIADGKIVIPAGSYVLGTITESKRPGRVKGRGELYLRFDSLTLPNGVTRDFRARVGSLDGSAKEELDRKEGRISSDTDKAGDAQTVATGASVGASVGAIAGSASGNTIRGLGIGAAAGAAAGVMGVLLSRGPDIVLNRGTTLEMVLDRPITFTAEELDFSAAPGRRSQLQPPPPEGNTERRGTLRTPGRLGRIWP
ncbi:MAG: hypothetical protein ACUVXB_02410 [Bryobacteraceae bacterium]